MPERRKVVTVLFCDLVGSTALGESTDPEVLRARLARVFADLRSVIERHGGSVEKFVGDAVMAVFGIPTAHEDDALRAVRAAFEMQAVVAEHGLEARVGVNTGEVVAGGGGESLVTGDAVNVAARLEQAAATGEILLGERTSELVRDAVRVERVGPLVLKGKSAPVPAFRLREIVGDVPVVRRLDSPLVGRERERRRLWRDYEDAVAERTCRLFTLLGPAGMGKSRLVADFLERVRDVADVLRGRCLAYGEGITYWPLVEMLTPLGVDPETVVGSTPEETRVAFRRLLESRAAERPQVVVVDDLQWAEPAFVDLVEHVADLSRGVPMLVLCVSRTELLDVRPDWGGGKPNVSSLLLEPLGSDESSVLVDHLVGGSIADDLRERILEAAGGVPLFLEEMLAMLRDGGEGGDGAVKVPPTIHALLQARIDSLPVTLRDVLERGAIQGEVFQRGAVASLAAEEPNSDLDASLAALIRSELIRPESSSPDDYRFRHILLRDAVYESMPKNRRARLHERFAGWLERTWDEVAFERDEILGYHLEQAFRLRAELGDADAILGARAAGHLARAGRGAQGRADFAAAKNLFERALVLPLPLDGELRLEAQLGLPHALMRLGELEQAESVLRETVDDARRANDVIVEARARLQLSWVRSRTHPEVSTDEVLREALELAETMEGLGDRVGLADALSRIGMSRFMLGHAGDGQLALERAAELAREAGDVGLERAVLTSMLRPIAYGPAPADEGLVFCDRLVASDITTAAERAHALHVRALLLAMRGDFGAARDSSARALALIDDLGLTLQRGIYAIDVGISEFLAGDLDAAERELRTGHDLLIRVGDAGVRATVDAILSDVMYLQGHDDRALQLADESHAAASVDDLDAQPRWRGARARVLSRLGEHEESLRLVREALAMLEPTDFIAQQAYVHDVHAEVLAASGRLEEAEAARERAIALHEEKGNVVSAAGSRAVLAGLRGARRS